MPDLQLEAFADAAGSILAQQRREWTLEHAAFMAEMRAALAETQRENYELRVALKAAADTLAEQQARMCAATVAACSNGDIGPEGPAGARGEAGPPGERGIGIAAIVRDGPRLLFELEDGRTFDVGDISGARGERGDQGQEGPAGRDGRDGLPGVPGSAGEKGIDGKDGRDGIDGKDGLGFDDLEILHDGDRTFTFRFTRGDVLKERRYVVPAQIYRGVYKEGERYDRGDTVTWRGAVWHCNADGTTLQPIDGASAWTLAVTKGRDGKDGKPGAKGDAGPEGRPGRDLTQKGPDGTKW